MVCRGFASELSLNCSVLSTLGTHISFVDVVASWRDDFAAHCIKGGEAAHLYFQFDSLSINLQRVRLICQTLRG